MGKSLDVIRSTNGSHWRISGSRSTVHDHILKGQFDGPGKMNQRNKRNRPLPYSKWKMLTKVVGVVLRRKKINDIF